MFISSNYPTKLQPNRGTFVRQLVKSIAERGVKCTVISPVRVLKKGELPPKTTIDNSIENNPITVMHPRYISFSNRNILNFNTFRITQKNYNRTVMKTVEKLEDLPTIVYGHFLYPSGFSGINIGKKYKIPSVVAVGESGSKLISSVEEVIGLKKTIEIFDGISGVISVSNQNTLYCQNKLNIPREKIKEFPNGIDRSLFYPRDKEEMRKKHGLPSEKTIIAFTGHFIDRKGPNRLLKAIKDIEGVEVIFIGEGPIELDSEKILFKGVLEHKLVPEYLSAADMFVLPTLAEGSCNAIIEAMGCGLPIISSNGDFNDDILNEKVSLRVDPMNIEEIRKAITLLHSEKEKSFKMRNESIKQSEKFDINKRAKKIEEWLVQINNDHKQ